MGSNSLGSRSDRLRWIRDLPPSVPPPQPGVESIIGETNQFIASAAHEAQRFLAWAEGKGVKPESAADFGRILRKYDSVIRDEMLAPAIAAYGEIVRREIGGEWARGTLFASGEPVVGVPWKPWTRRRIVHEAIRAFNEV